MGDGWIIVIAIVAMLALTGFERTLQALLCLAIPLFLILILALMARERKPEEEERKRKERQEKLTKKHQK